MHKHIVLLLFIVEIIYFPFHTLVSLAISVIAVAEGCSARPFPICPGGIQRAKTTNRVQTLQTYPSIQDIDV